jgi:hypothetical protein
MAIDWESVIDWEVIDKMSDQEIEALSKILEKLD